MDPGTSLAVVSLAVQVANGLLSYYELWKDCDEDVMDIQRSLLWLANIFAQLDITLLKPNLQEEIVLIIHSTVKGCEKHVSKLQELLNKVKKEGTPHALRAKFQVTSRRMLYIFHSKEIRGLKALLKELRGEMDLAINLLNLHTSATSLNELRSFQDRLNALKASFDEASNVNDTSMLARVQETKRAVILHWLAPCNVSILHVSAYEQHEAGTGRWFLDGARFSQWCSSEGQFLWLFGDVGCGKTILCASIIEELRMSKADATRDMSKDNVVYFYFTFDDTNRQDISAFLKSALAQLCPKESMLLQLEDLFQGCSPDPPSVKALQTALILALKSFCGAAPTPDLECETSIEQETMDETKSSHTYMILDGLDEIPYGSQRTAVLRFLCYITRLNLPRLHLLATSRQERDIELCLLSSPKWDLLCIQQSNVETDLGIYVANQISENPKLQVQPENIKDKIKNKLVLGAGGMFRWVALQMEELKKLRILRGRDIMNILSALPKDLDATYDRILLGIDSSLAYEASSALQWLACASRPLFLEELAEACIIRPKDSTPLEEDQRLSPMDISEVLPGLTKVEPALTSSMDFRPRHHIISLAHFSVKEYLFSQRILVGSARSYMINSGLAQRHITHSCLAYIAYSKFVLGASSHVDSQHPLRLYAYSRWALHAVLVPGNLLNDICFYATDLFKAPKLCLDWCAYTNISRRSTEENKPQWLDIPFGWYKTPRWPTYYLFCYAVLVGNETLMTHLLEIGLQVGVDRGLGHPLKLAARHGHKTIAQRLLAAGADNTGALMAALENGHEPTVTLLLESVTRVSRSEFLLAVERCSKPVVSLFLTKAPVPKLVHILEAINIALGKQKAETASLLLNSLFSKKFYLNPGSCLEPGDKQLLLFKRCFQNAIKLNSQKLINFLLRCTPKSALQLLDSDALFLETIVQGRTYAAKAFREYPWFRVSERARIFEQHWNRVLPHDMACLHILAIFDWLLQLETALLLNGANISNFTKRNWEMLRSATSSAVDFYRTIWTRFNNNADFPYGRDIYGKEVPPDLFDNLRMPLSSDQRALTYLSLSGPHSSCIGSIYSTEMIRRYKLEGFLKPAGRGPSLRPEIESDEPSFLDHLPWKELLFYGLATEQNASYSEVQHHPTFRAWIHTTEMKSWHNKMLASWPDHLSFPPYIFWTDHPTRKDLERYEERASNTCDGTNSPNNSLQLRHIRLSLETRPKEYIRDRLQLSSPYYIILEGLVPKRTLTNERWLQSPEFDQRPKGRVYIKILEIDLPVSYTMIGLSVVHALDALSPMMAPLAAIIQ